ncbi:hypothetical protein C0991_006916 [Blastosporella zonata]|nr:hypothetical protein C0991_006916 [Blastosporella zonata]
MVYEDAEKLYAEVRKDGEALLDDAFSVLFPNSIALNLSTNLKTLPLCGKVVGFNTTFFRRSDLIQVPLVGANSDLKSQVLQTSSDGKVGYAVMNTPGGGSVGTICTPATGLHAQILPVSGVSHLLRAMQVLNFNHLVFTNGSDNFVLRNSCVQLTISKGRITSLLDVKLEYVFAVHSSRSTLTFVRSRELIAKGATGGLVIFEDQPNYWDAWDVEVHHLESAKPLEFTNISVVAQGPLRGSVKAVVKYDKSTIEVTISLDAITASVKENSRSLFHFDAVVDWHQRHEFLKCKASFTSLWTIPLTHVEQLSCPWISTVIMQHTTLNLGTSNALPTRIPLGTLRSEFGYGVAILSESKYGFSCLGNMLRISLLRSATAPDAEQDQGEHKFSWAVLPHEGHFLESDVPVAAYLYNSPVRVRYVPKGGDVTMSTLDSPFTVEGARNVFLETVKRGENDDFSKESGTTTVVLRLYEAFGGHAQAMLRIGGHLAIAKAYITNLLEEDDNELNIFRADDPLGTSTLLKLDFRGFEVKTVKLVLQPAPVIVGQSA